jgi:hypothetical protein
MKQVVPVVVNPVVPAAAPVVATLLAVKTKKAITGPVAMQGCVNTR